MIKKTDWAKQKYFRYIKNILINQEFMRKFQKIL